MKRVTFPGAAVLVLLVAGTLAGQADIDVILDQLTGETPVESQTEDAMKKAQLAAFKYLLNDMGAENPLDRAEPQTTFEKSCHYVSRPGADPERSHWCRSVEPG